MKGPLSDLKVFEMPKEKTKIQVWCQLSINDKDQFVVDTSYSSHILINQSYLLRMQSFTACWLCYTKK